ncbi:MAG: PorV/PorQ family protein [Elusimicrobiota bacterium]
MRSSLACALAASLGSLPVSSAAGVFPDSAFSNKASGTTGAAFLKIPTGSRAQALAGSYSAAADGAEAMFWNPAGLARMEEQGLSELGFGYSALLESSYASALAFAKPLAPQARGVFGAAFTYFSQSSIQGYNTVGDPADSFTPNDLCLAVAYAGRMRNVNLGAGTKFLRSKLADASGMTFAVDLGIQIQRVADVGEGPIDFGLSLLNLGPAIQTGSMADPLPMKVQAGMLWNISPRIRFMLDGHLPVDHDPYPSMGLEGHLPVGDGMRASARAGMQFRDRDDIGGLAGLAAGAGLDMKRFRFDYAWVPYGDLGNTHRISGGWRF